MIPRRDFLTLLGGAAAWPVVARAQQMRRIGVLMAFTETDPEGQASIALFRQALQGSGWVDGDNVQIFVRWAGPQQKNHVLYAKQLVDFSPNVILASSTNVLIPLLKETRSIPIVFVSVSDPLSQGIVTSLARPGGNVTGFSNPPFSLVGKSLQMLKEVAPGVSRVALVISGANGSAPVYFRELDAIAKSFAITPVKTPFNNRLEIERAIDAFAREPNGGLFVPRDIASEAARDLFVKLAASHHLPAVYARRVFVTGGGLMSYGSDSIEQYRGAASYVDRIFRGERPGDLPVQEPTKYELTINMKTAKALGLDVPPTLLARADEVIE